MAAGIGPTLCHRLEEAFGSPEAVCNATVSQLRQVDGIGRKRAEQIRHGLDEADLDAEWQLIDEFRVKLITIDEPTYPALLRHIHDPPRLLYVRGQMCEEDNVALAVVGARRCTAYGREQADRLSAGCAQAGLTIVSGGARGIDSAAHRAALRINGRTIAVLGCGLAVCYPPENEELFNQIVDGGAVISELPMAAPPIAENFPRRNRIISGLSLGVLVVEASNRSGALITARLAAEEQHREVMVVPGRLDSQASAGCHRIVREGWAQLITNVADILDALGETGQALRAAIDEEPAPATDDQPSAAADVDTAGLNDQQRAVLDAIGTEATMLDTVCHRSGLDIGVMQSHLTFLQLRGLVERLPGNRVRRRR